MGSESWFQNGQILDFEDDVEDVNTQNVRDIKEKIKKNIRKQQKKTLSMRSTSYVITRAPKKATRMIKIEITDLITPLSSNEISESESVVSAQYIVSEPIDEIMDMTENLVNKICKKLCNECI